MGRGNESLLGASGSHYQDGRHAHIWINPSKIFLFGTKGPMTLGIGALGPIKVCSNDDLRLTLTYFMARSNLVP